MEEKEKLIKKRKDNYNLKYSLTLLIARAQKISLEWKKAQSKFKKDINFIFKKMEEIESKVDLEQEEIKKTLKYINKHKKENNYECK